MKSQYKLIKFNKNLFKLQLIKFNNKWLNKIKILKEQIHNNINNNNNYNNYNNNNYNNKIRYKMHNKLKKFNKYKINKNQYRMYNNNNKITFSQ